MTQKFKFITVVVALLPACSPLSTLPPRDPEFAPVQPADLRPVTQNTGGIYQAGYDMRLFEDHTAKRVGDVLTIKLEERTQAKKQADLDTKKDTNISGTVPSLFGVATSSLLGSDMQTEVDFSTQFKGKGGADQSNSLSGNISVTVVEVMPNGNLRVRGEKRMTLNQGDEYVRLSGIVRPVDIDAANAVSSDRVADATIMYTGNGATADASKAGWFSRILMSPWFPF